VEALTKSILAVYDWGYGGWGDAPKFPQPMTIEFLLRQVQTESAQKEQALKAVKHVLDAMSRGGMYDVVGGGFSRYSVDNFWKTPHFEKMLYDNAQLALSYLHGYLVTGEARYRQICEETLDFILREMTHPDGGFYSSLDADSEGEEGKFYVWSQDEIQAALGEDFDFFKQPMGSFHKATGKGKPSCTASSTTLPLSARFQLNLEQVPVKLADCHSKLLALRSMRVTAWHRRQGPYRMERSHAGGSGGGGAGFRYTPVPRTASCSTP
jgi:uncharacterized protein